MMKIIKLSIMRNNLLLIAGLILLLSGLGINGCASKLHSVNMNYDAEKANIPGYLKNNDKSRSAEIAVAEFADIRKLDEPMVIGRVVEKDGMKTLVLPRYTKPTQAVSSGIKKYLIKAGYRTTSASGPWDLKEETISKVKSKLLIGGSIEELELICRKGFPTDSYKALIKLNLVLADPAKGKILYRSSVESNTSLEHVSFSEARLEEQINIALADAIEKIFEDRKIAQKLKEALAE